MNLRNATETRVTSSVNRRKAEMTADRSSCWCSHCEADIMAIALSRLAPLYWTACNFEHFMRDEALESIESAVTAAVTRVTDYPQHKRDDGFADSLRLVNMNLEEANRVMEALAGEGGLPCGCETCSSDMIAFSLNRCPPRYAVERNGVLNYPEAERRQIRQQVSVMLAVASGVVASQPRCSGGSGEPSGDRALREDFS